MITPREHFAGLFAAAMMGCDNIWPPSIAGYATTQADALVAELERTGPRTAVRPVPPVPPVIPVPKVRPVAPKAHS